VVILTIREETKIQTRKHIIDCTTKLLAERGFIKISSKEIAINSGVSQGTIFLHFQTKNDLLSIILMSNIEKLENAIKLECDVKKPAEDMLKTLLDVIADNEDILARVYKDYYYLDDYITKNVDSLETIIKNLIYDNIRKTTNKNMSIVDAFISIDALMSQIKDYLMSKNNFGGQPILKQRRGRILKLYKVLFQ